MQLILERAGHTVQETTNVEEALQALRETQFDLIVCDYEMPGKTGLDFLEELRRNQWTIPFLIVSAISDSTAESRATQLGAAGFLKKPVRRYDLIESIRRATNPST
jgi:two-component system phosphate regulon response regulator PhoB